VGRGGGSGGSFFLVEVEGLQGSKRGIRCLFLFAVSWCCGAFYLFCVAALGRSDVGNCFVSVPMV
jgi:hypothetical protein